MYLQDLNQEVSVLKGVGPALAGRLARIGVRTVSDLLSCYPKDYQDRRERDELENFLKKERINILVHVHSSEWTGRGYQKILKICIKDNSGQAFLICFGRPYFKNILVPGKLFWVSGSFKMRYGELQCSNFDLEAYEERSEWFGRIIPLYGLTEGLTQKTLRRLIGQALHLIQPEDGPGPEKEPRPGLSNELPEYLRRRRGLLEKHRALRAIHFPESKVELESARRSLIYEELFYYQMALGKSRWKRKSIEKRRLKPPFNLKEKLLKRLPFPLTADQEKVLLEIEKDLFSVHPAARLLQGEVGSGKTHVAFLACLDVIESGEQVAFMAPTELLARQHADTAAGIFEPLGVKIAFLSGSIKEKARQKLRRALAGQEIDILIGTHALFSEDIRYKKLGLVVVDEQHRFGVRQRQAILEKGNHPDLLLMTATPIPRTLTMSIYGDLELSEIRELPEGRKPVLTHLTRQGNEEKVYERVRLEVRKGRQAYFVYPLIEESGMKELKDAESMYRKLAREVFPDFRVELIHSRVPEDRQRLIMYAFTSGKVNILVATTVMEVGLNVPNATCIVIEQAERFGLSSLHQLRGRVGRGNEQSFAYLIYGRELTAEGVQRLKIIKTTNDGFEIAEEDLKIRGPGNLLGFQQAGFFKLGLADLWRDRSVFLTARKDVYELLENDPGRELLHGADR